MQDLRRCYSDFSECSQCNIMTEESFFPEYEVEPLCDKCFMNTIVSYKVFIKKRKMEVSVKTFETFTGWRRSSSFNEDYFSRRLINLCINIL